MIQPKELRIGNCVYFDTRLDKITSLGQTLVVAEMHSHYYCERIHPVPLTPELLEKCGFKINGFYEFDFKLSEYSRLVLDLRQGYLWLRESDISRKPHNDSIVCLWNRDYKKALYLHQLQNLYFALTGEEITVKL